MQHQPSEYRQQPPQQQQQQQQQQQYPRRPAQQPQPQQQQHRQESSIAEASSERPELRSSTIDPSTTPLRRQDDNDPDPYPHQYQQSPPAGNGMLKPRARGMSSGNKTISTGTTAAAATPAEAALRHSRDSSISISSATSSSRQLQSPPSSPRLQPTTAATTTPTPTPTPDTGATTSTSAAPTAATATPPAPRSGRAGHGLSLSIPRRLSRSDWVNLEGLVTCALSWLGKECTGISELGCGSRNSLYELTFSDGTSCAASISNSPPQFFSADARRSEIATMQYLHSSPLYNIPIPKVYGWDLTFDNPVGAPYILRECVRGTNMATDGRFYRLSSVEKLKVIKELAYVQAELSKPSEFKQLGFIYQREDGDKGFYVGKMATLPSGSAEEDALREPFLGPYDSLTELWEARIEREALSAIGNWSQLPSDASLPSRLPPSKANPQEFGELLQLLSGLYNMFTPPTQYSALCIHHSDFAIRNVLFDEETLKITGVIDWEFASVMPLVVTARFPADLGWEGNQFARSLGMLGNTDMWNHHYYDFTSLNRITPPAADIPSPPASPAPSEKGSAQEDDYLSTPNATANGCRFQAPEHDFLCEEGLPSPPSPPLPPPPTSETPQRDLEVRGQRLVELFYYRKAYASKVASRDFRLTRLFIDSVAYLKFNEVVTGGADKWFLAADWIKEVYWRLQEDPTSWNDLQEGRKVVHLPEVFESERRHEVDLGRWEKRASASGGYRR